MSTHVLEVCTRSFLCKAFDNIVYSPSSEAANPLLSYLDGNGTVVVVLFYLRHFVDDRMLEVEKFNCDQSAN